MRIQLVFALGRVTAISFYWALSMVTEIRMSRGGSRLARRMFTVNERVLLHLKESGSASHAVEIPAPMTQEGIATALGIRINHVSRAVKSLQGKGLIRQATARIKGEIRKRKIYLITEEGMTVANGVISKIGEALVSVRDSRQRIREMPAKEVRALMPLPRTYTSMLSKLDERDVLDVYKAKAKTRRIDAVARFVGAPEEIRFHGRVEELKKVRAWLQLKKPPIMLIIGRNGIGKTALAMQAVKHIGGKRPLFWFSCNDDSGEGFISALSGFLRELGKVDFTIHENEGTDSLRKRIEANLIGVGAVLVLDNFDADYAETSDVARVLMRAALATGSQVLMTTTESAPWKRGLPGRGEVEVLQLQGLDKASCRDLAPNLNDEEFAKAFKITRGSPLEMKLLSDHADEEIGDEELTAEERIMLRYLRLIHER